MLVSCVSEVRQITRIRADCSGIMAMSVATVFHLLIKRGKAPYPPNKSAKMCVKTTNRISFLLNEIKEDQDTFFNWFRWFVYTNACIACEHFCNLVKR